MGLVTRIGHAILGLVSRSAVRPATAWTASYSDPLAEMPMLQEQIKTYAAAGNLRLRHTQVMDNFSGETSEMRAAYRRAFLAEPTIKSALLGKISSVQTMPLQVMPASESRLDKEVAEFIKWTLTTCKGGVPELVWDIATGGLVDGWSICEKLFYEIERGKYAGKIGLERLKAKDTYYIQLEVDPYRNITGVFPFQGNAGSKFDPGDFVIFNYLSLFESPTGVSDLRASYRAAEMIPAILKLRMIFLDKYIGPFLKGSVSDVQLRQQMQTELAKARQGGFIVTDPGTDIEMINLATSGTADFQSALEDMRQEVAVGISGAFLHMMTGMNPGARGDSAVQQDTVDLFIWLLSAKISECIQSQIVPDLVNWNYGSTVDYPIVSLGKESMDDVNAAIEVFGGVQSLGLPLSRKEVYERTRVSPPVDEQDALQPPGAGGMGGPDGGMPGQPAPMGNPNDPNADPMGGDQLPALPIGGNDLDADNSGSMDYDQSLALFDAMLQASIRAQQGDTTAQDELDALAEIAGNPNLVELSQFAESAWVSAGKSKSGKNKWKNTATGRIRYQENRPGEKAERRATAHANVQQLVQKNYEYINSGGQTEPLTGEEWADLAQQLPNLKVDQLRGVRNALMLKVKDQKRHADWVTELQRQAKEIASGTGGEVDEKSEDFVVPERSVFDRSHLSTNEAKEQAQSRIFAQKTPSKRGTASINGKEVKGDIVGDFIIHKNEKGSYDIDLTGTGLHVIDVSSRDEALKLSEMLGEVADWSGDIGDQKKNAKGLISFVMNFRSKNWGLAEHYFNELLGTQEPQQPTATAPNGHLEEFLNRIKNAKSHNEVDDLKREWNSGNGLRADSGTEGLKSVNEAIVNKRQELSKEPQPAQGVATGVNQPQSDGVAAATAESTPQETKAKEPHEMTAAEYQTKGPANYGDMVSVNGKVGFLQGGNGGLGSDRVKLVDQNGQTIGHFSRGDVKLIRRQGFGSGGTTNQLDPEFMRQQKKDLDSARDEYADVLLFPEKLMNEQQKARLAEANAKIAEIRGRELQFDKTTESPHKNQVEQALKDGKTVPPEVLADYPDLAEKYGPKQQDQGFTGTDAQGREWRNGELVAKVEEPTAPEPQAADEALDFGMDAMYPTVDESKPAEKPAPTTKAEGQIYTAKDVRQQQHIIDSLKDRGADQAQIDRAYDRLEHMNRNRADGEKKPQADEPVLPEEKAAKRSPWQKTLSESKGAVDGGLNKGNIAEDHFGNFISKNKNGNFIVFKAGSTHAQSVAEFADESVARAQLAYISKQSHKKTIEQALKDGKPVPPEVLADYPDLQAKYGQGQASPQSDEAVLPEEKAADEALGGGELPPHVDKRELNTLDSKIQRHAAVMERNKAIWNKPNEIPGPMATGRSGYSMGKKLDAENNRKAKAFEQYQEAKKQHDRLTAIRNGYIAGTNHPNGQKRVAGAVEERAKAKDRNNEKIKAKGYDTRKIHKDLGIDGKSTLDDGREVSFEMNLDSDYPNGGYRYKVTSPDGTTQYGGYHQSLSKMYSSGEIRSLLASQASPQPAGAPAEKPAPKPKRTAEMAQAERFKLSEERNQTQRDLLNAERLPIGQREKEVKRLKSERDRLDKQMEKLKKEEDKLGGVRYDREETSEERERREYQERQQQKAKPKRPRKPAGRSLSELENQVKAEQQTAGSTPNTGHSEAAKAKRGNFNDFESATKTRELRQQEYQDWLKDNPPRERTPAEQASDKAKILAAAKSGIEGSPAKATTPAQIYDALGQHMNKDDFKAYLHEMHQNGTLRLGGSNLESGLLPDHDLTFSIGPQMADPRAPWSEHQKMHERGAKPIGYVVAGENFNSEQGGN